MKKDFLGNDLNVGDKIAFAEAGFKNMLLGEVIGFTATMTKIKYISKPHFDDRPSCNRESAYIVKLKE